MYYAKLTASQIFLAKESTAPVLADSATTPCFEEYGGSDEIRKITGRVMDFLVNGEYFQRGIATPQRGLFLFDAKTYPDYDTGAFLVPYAQGSLASAIGAVRYKRRIEVVAKLPDRMMDKLEVIVVADDNHSSDGEMAAKGIWNLFLRENPVYRKIDEKHRPESWRIYPPAWRVQK